MKKLNAVVYYSNTGQSKAVAEYLAERLEYPLINITDVSPTDSNSYRNLVAVFPIHCQNIPRAVKNFLKSITVESLTAVATYGKMCCGNALYEIQRDFQHNVVAGAYIPTKHCYIDGDSAFGDFEKLDPLIKKIKEPSNTIKLPRLYKNPFASFFPLLRGRLGVTVKKGKACNGCNLCAKRCPLAAIELGKTNGRCIRCLRCVDICPQGALTAKIGLPLKLYLRKKKINETIIFI